MRRRARKLSSVSSSLPLSGLGGPLLGNRVPTVHRSLSPPLAGYFWGANLVLSKKKWGSRFCSPNGFKVLWEPDCFVRCTCPQQASRSPTCQNTLKEVRWRVCGNTDSRSCRKPSLSCIHRRERGEVGFRRQDPLAQLCHFKTFCFMLENLFLLSNFKH